MININQELSQNFLDFSYEANSQRAFADARDGLKPGQRACLWEMYSKGYSSAKPHVKSAKISGGVISSWWPHGNVAIYDTFARMSQSWINNIPEVDWHGANGSIQISGEAAADRYTEARLSKSTEDGLFVGIKKNNVPMKLNFSEDEEWPEVLPALYPRLMVNGCQGIGSTIANVWLPHSLDELAEVINEYLKTDTINYSKLAPSFPTGGIIVNKDELETIYKTGKGKVVLRAKTEIVGNNILITEIPYQIYVEPFIESVRQLILKDELTNIVNITNKSNKKQLLIEIECDANPSIVLTKLFQKTDLQKTFNANQYALIGKTPKLLNFKDYIDTFLNHNYQCIEKEYTYDLEKSKKRLEIVEGLIKALEDIDNIIALIKSSNSSKDAVTNLINKYQFTENQAQAIVNMKLGRLAHLEVIELNQEKIDLTSTITNCEDIITHLDKKKQIFIERFNSFVKKYPNPRKTQLTQLNYNPKVEKEIINVEPEKCVVVVTEGGTIKRIPIASFKIQKRNGKGVKSQEDITHCVIRTNTIDNLMLFTNKGIMYKLLVNDIPVGTNASAGTPISALVKMSAGEQVITIYSIYRDTNAKYVLFATKQGLIKKVPLEEYTGMRKKTGVSATTLHNGDNLANVSLIKDEQLIVLTKNGYAIKINSSELGTSSRIAMGVKAINLVDSDQVACVLPIRDATDYFGIFTRNGFSKKINLNELSLQKRAGRGIVVYKPTAETGEVIDASLINDTDNLFICGDKKNICISAKDIICSGRTAIGNSVIKNEKIKKVTKI